MRLGPLTYLVGPNGGGKSNFLDALRFVADTLKHSISHALRSRGGGASICHAPHKPQGYFRIHLEFATPAGGNGFCTLKVGMVKNADEAGQWEMLEDKIDLPAEVQTGRSSREGSILALTRMLFFNILPRKIEDVVTFEPGRFLLPDGSNLASVLFSLGTSDADVVERINEYLRLILPGLHKVSAFPALAGQTDISVDSQKVALLFEQQFQDAGKHAFWPSQMSEGTLRSLGILTALSQAAVPEGARPSLVAIEEPESQVHPPVVGVLRDAMIEASYNTQVLVTTQSADILDNKDVETDAILVVTADGGVTRLGPINAIGQDLIRRQLYSPGELLRIGHLFPENGHANGLTVGKPSETAGERS